MNIDELINKDKEMRNGAKQVILDLIAQYALKGPEGYGVIFEGMTCAIYKPWEKLNNLYFTALSSVRLYMVKQFMELAPDGLCYECGVYTGGVVRMMLDNGKTVKAFDTFEGLKGSSEHDYMLDGEYNGGDVSDYIDGAIIVKGEIPDSFCGHEDDSIAFAHLDLDLYLPTLSSLYFIYPRLVDGGIIVLDDYGLWMTPGVKKAVDEFKPKRSVYLPTGQLVIFK